MGKKAFIQVKNKNGEFEKVFPITKLEYVQLPDGEKSIFDKFNEIDNNLLSKIDISSKGKVNGVASLDENGMVPRHQIPIQNREIKVVEDIAELNSITNLFEGLMVYVKDATGDTSVSNGGAYYIYDGRKFEKLNSSSTTTMTVRFENIENKPSTLEGYGITDAIDKSQLTTTGGYGNEGKIITLNKNGDLDVNITGRSNSTSRLDTPRRISLSGDAIGEAYFDGGSNITIDVDLISRGIRPGEWTKVGVDDKGRIISVSKIIESDLPNIDWSKIQGKPTNLIDFGITDQIMTRNNNQLMTAYLSLEKEPIDELHAVNKKYVDSLAQGLAVKESVSIAIDENIELSGLQIINGYQLKENERVLVLNQNNKVENGIYNTSNGYWTRSIDADENSEYISGMSVFVLNGNYEGCGFVLLNSDKVEIGVDDIIFTQFSSAAGIVTGAGLIKTGNTIELETLGTPGEYIKVTVDSHGRVTYGKKQIMESDINGGISWSKLKNKPISSVDSIDEAVTRMHYHLNKSVIDKLSENAEGELLFNGEKISTDITSEGNLDGTITFIGNTEPTELATGGIWFKTNTVE